MSTQRDDTLNPKGEQCTEMSGSHIQGTWAQKQQVARGKVPECGLEFEVLRHFSCTLDPTLHSLTSSTNIANSIPSSYLVATWSAQDSFFMFDFAFCVGLAW